MAPPADKYPMKIAINKSIIERLASEANIKPTMPVIESSMTILGFVRDK
jgi:hypothetical protein